jgi:hypothetical protein
MMVRMIHLVGARENGRLPARAAVTTLHLRAGRRGGDRGPASLASVVASRGRPGAAVAGFRVAGEAEAPLQFTTGTKEPAD